MKEQDSFKELGLGMLSNGSEKDHRLFLEEEKPEKDNSRGDFYVVGNTISSDGSASVDKGQWEADGMPISLKRFNDGGVEVDFGKLPEGPKGKPLEKADTDNKPVKSESRWLKRARKVFTVATAAAAVSVPAIAEEVQDQAIEIDTDEVREKINSVTTAEPSPAPTAELTILDAQYDEERYEPYFQMAREYGINDEGVVDFCGRFMFAIENYRDNTDSLKSRVSTTDVLEYGLNGTTDKFDVYMEDGEPMFPIVYNDDNPDSSVIDWFSKTLFSFKENGCPDITKSMKLNGVNLFYIDPAEDGGGAVFGDDGVIVVNTSCDDIKKWNDATYFFARIFVFEPPAIAISNMMLSVDKLGNYFGVTETGKAILAACDSTYRLIKNDGGLYLDLAYECVAAIDTFTRRHEITIDDPYLIRLLYSAVNSGAVNPMNSESSWNDIFNTLVIEVLDWDGVDITDEEKFGEMIVALHDAIPGFLGQ